MNEQNPCKRCGEIIDAHPNRYLADALCNDCVGVVLDDLAARVRSVSWPNNGSGEDGA